MRETGSIDVNGSFPLMRRRKRPLFPSVSWVQGTEQWLKQEFCWPEAVINSAIRERIVSSLLFSLTIFGM